MTPEQLEALSLMELESIAYKQIIQRDLAQSNLNILNQIIAKKSQVEPKKIESVKVSK